MSMKSQWVIILLFGGLLAGCGATQQSLDQTALNLELTIHANHGDLTASVNQSNGSVLSSTPLPLKEALQNPIAHYGTLLGPADSWTLVFGAEPKNPSRSILVNGHRAIQKTVKSGYVVWHYFLPGPVSHPTVKTVGTA